MGPRWHGSCPYKHAHSSLVVQPLACNITQSLGGLFSANEVAEKKKAWNEKVLHMLISRIRRPGQIVLGEMLSSDNIGILCLSTSLSSMSDFLLLNKRSTTKSSLMTLFFSLLVATSPRWGPKPHTCYLSLLLIFSHCSF